MTRDDPQVVDPTDPTMYCEGVAVLFIRIALARGDDPLPIELIAEEAGVSVWRAAQIAARMRRVALGAAPGWFDIVAHPNDWVRTCDITGGDSNALRRLQRSGVPSAGRAGITYWHRPALEAWAAR